VSLRERRGGCLKPYHFKEQTVLVEDVTRVATRNWNWFAYLCPLVGVLCSPSVGVSAFLEWASEQLQEAEDLDMGADSAVSLLCRLVGGVFSLFTTILMALLCALPTLVRNCCKTVVELSGPVTMSFIVAPRQGSAGASNR
jgi:hypothetical protein